MKEEVNVQILNVYHIPRKSDRRKITSRHIQIKVLRFSVKKKKSSGIHIAKESHFQGEK